MLFLAKNLHEIREHFEIERERRKGVRVEKRERERERTSFKTTKYKVNSGCCI